MVVFIQLCMMKRLRGGKFSIRQGVSSSAFVLTSFRALRLMNTLSNLQALRLMPLSASLNLSQIHQAPFSKQLSVNQKRH